MILSKRRFAGLVLGPVLFFTLWFGSPFEGLSDPANATLAITIWMALWWIAEIVPIAVTALLPIVLLPLTGAAAINQTTAAYGDKMLYLFLGGFVIAIAMEKWDLHRRIALSIIQAIGSSPPRILLGFMLSTGILSMWISNSATTLMMVTIGSAVISQASRLQSGDAIEGFFKSLLLGIAFSASIGGVGTLVGTPTNPIFAAIANEYYGADISFLDWMKFGVPFSLALIFFTWWFLAFVFFGLHKIDLHMGSRIIRDELNSLGSMKFEEKAVAWVFGITAALWIIRSFVLQRYIPGINDTSIVIGMAITLFVIPSKKTGKMGLLSWEEAVRLPWGVILLFGGGLSLAAAFKSTGLAEWIGHQMALFEAIPLFVAILLITLIVNYLTEVTSNVATASIMLPVLAALSEVIGVHPYLLMIPATMAASCAFMLPVATGPNAIVFGLGRLTVADMARAGAVLNLVSSLLISLIGYYVLTYVFGI